MKGAGNMKYEFPKGFQWGVASSAPQTEGASFEDGKGVSVWDMFARIPDMIADDTVPDVACDEYHLYEQDIALMKKMGINTCRFSVSWARVIPDGEGEVNQAGLDYYKRYVKCLKENGITPHITMFHWDLPYALQLKGGFGNRDIVKWFTNYANVLLDALGEEVEYWTTFNEPIALKVGYGEGTFAPGLADEKYARQALHNALVCHGEVVKLFRSKNFKNGKIGIVIDVWKHYALRPGDPEDEKLAVYNNEVEGYGIFLNPLYLGGYSKEYMDYLVEKDMVPQIEDGDFETIGQPMDFHAVNFYTGLYDDHETMFIGQKRVQKVKLGGNYQNRPKRKMNPEKIYDVLHMLVEKYHIDIPIIISENGYIQMDYGDMPMEEFLDDEDRIEYLQEVLKHVHKAMQEGMDIRGYYIWSLIDNWEWNAGFSMRYGLVYTNFDTLERVPKKSAGWYENVIANNGFEDDPLA